MRVLILMLLVSCLIYAFDEAYVEPSWPEVPQRPAYRFSTYVDERDGTTYHILSVRRYLSNGKYDGEFQDPMKYETWIRFDDFVEFNIFTENVRFKTPNSIDTLGERYYPRTDLANICPEGWQVASNLAQGGILIRNDSLFISLLPYLDDSPDTTFAYRNIGFFYNRAQFIPNSNRFWSNDSTIHPTMMIGYDDSNRMDEISPILEKYPLESPEQYLSVRCMRSSKPGYKPIFTDSLTSGLEQSFVYADMWNFAEELIAKHH